MPCCKAIARPANRRAISITSFDAPDDKESYERIYLAVRHRRDHGPAAPGIRPHARYADIVGPCDLRTSLAPTRLVVGQPALFTVHLDNLVLARHITGLPSAAFDGLRPEFQLSAEPIRETATDHTRSFTRILRPLHAGITRIPAVVIQTFNPGSGEYQTLRSVPIPITVEPDRGRGVPRRRASDGLQTADPVQWDPTQPHRASRP